MAPTELENLKAAAEIISDAQLRVRELIPGTIHSVKLLQVLDHLVHEIDQTEEAADRQVLAEGFAEMALEAMRQDRSSAPDSRSGDSASDNGSDRTQESS